MAELERVCDYLVLITDGQVQLAGDIDSLLGDHLVLTGPSTDVPDGPEVIQVERADRHAHVVARIGAADPIPGWESHPVGLEELVLAYLQRSHDGEVRETRDGKVLNP